MLTQVADGVLVHVSEFIQSNSVVVQGENGVLLVDPGITGDEMADLSNDLRDAALMLEAGGPAMWQEMMVGLRHEHLGAEPALT